MGFYSGKEQGTNLSLKEGADASREAQKGFKFSAILVSMMRTLIQAYKIFESFSLSERVSKGCLFYTILQEKWKGL